MSQKSLFDFLWSLGIRNIFPKENGKVCEVALINASDEQVYSFALELPNYKKMNEEQEIELRTLIIKYKSAVNLL